MTSVRCASVSRDRPPPKLDCCQLMNHHHVLKQDRFTQPACHPTQPSKLPAIIPQTLPYTPTPPSTLHPVHTHFAAADWGRGMFSPWEMDAQCHGSELVLHKTAARKNWRGKHGSTDVSRSLQTEATSCFYTKLHELQETKNPRRTPLNKNLKAGFLQPGTYTVYYNPQCEQAEWGC